MTSETLPSGPHAAAIDAFQTGNYPLAAGLLAPLLAQSPDDAVLLRLYGMALVRTGAATDALAPLARSVAVAPGDAVSATWHGIALHAAGRHAEAAGALEKAVALTPARSGAADPSVARASQTGPAATGPGGGAAGGRAGAYPARSRPCGTDRHPGAAAGVPGSAPARLAGAWLALGRICMRMDKVGEARMAFREALGLQPLQADAECELALVEHLCGQPVTATARLAAVLAREPGCHLARIALASRHLLDDDAAAALAVLDAGGRPPAGPLRSRWHAERAQALIALGRDDAAGRELAQAEQDPASGLDLLLSWQRLVLARRASRPEVTALADRVARLATIRDAGTLEHRIDAHFDLADLRRAEGQIRRPPSAHWKRGHALLSGSRSRFPGRSTRTLSRRRSSAEFGTRTAWRPWPALPTLRDPTPVFIVGLPRTGTTLLEQILSAHPHRCMPRGSGWPMRETLMRLTGSHGRRATAMTRASRPRCGNPDRLRRPRYLADLQALAPDAVRVLDKMPDNVFQLGFLSRPCCPEHGSSAAPATCAMSVPRSSSTASSGYHPYAHDLADLGWYIAQASANCWRIGEPACRRRC